MVMHGIEVDDEVYRYLQRRARAFVDTPNTVLRRELLGRPGRATSDHSASGSSELPDLPAMRPGTPKALQHILQVTRLTRQGPCSRPQATHLVAEKEGVTFQTVLDKYTRQLGVSAEEFDGLLEDDRLSDLKRTLRRRFERHREVIAEYLG